MVPFSLVLAVSLLPLLSLSFCFPTMPGVQDVWTSLIIKRPGRDYAFMGNRKKAIAELARSRSGAREQQKGTCQSATCKSAHRARSKSAAGAQQERSSSSAAGAAKKKRFRRPRGAGVP